MLAECGDFNAKLSNNIRFSHQTETFDNGERLLDFCDGHQLVVTSMRFQKHYNRLWSYEDRKKQGHQIDYLLWWKKWANSVKDYQVYK